LYFFCAATASLMTLDATVVYKTNNSYNQCNFNTK
jgi:hypothetical protein